ncbi:MAG: regulatory protein RecX [Thermoanaerobaculia bacterium]
MSPFRVRKPRKPAGDSPEDPAPEVERPSADDKAARLLAQRPHFRRELEQKLSRSGYDREEIELALDKLVRLKLLDDEGLAKRFVETVARRKSFGRTRIAQELARRGAPDAARRAALETQSGDDDLERARELARRWLQKGGTDRDRLARQLDRKGFGKNAIFKVLKEMALESPDPEGLAEDDSGAAD